MRIALITTEYVTEENYDGGLANYTHRLALALIQLGHDPVVFVSSEKDESFNYQGVIVFRIKSKLILPKNIKFQFLIRKIYRLAYFFYQSWKLNKKINQINLLNPFDILQYTQLDGVGLFRPKHIPVVIRLSSYTPWVRKAYEIKGGWLQDLVEYWALRKADKIFCPSKIIAEIVMEKYKFSVTVIESPFFIEAMQFDDNKYQEYLAGRRYLLFFGTIGILKGVKVIAKIVRDFLNDHPEFVFVFVGKDIGTDKKNSMIDFVKEKANPFQERVVYLGKLKKEMLYPIVQHAEIVVLPSRVDNFPNTCLEAMAFECIVIGTRGTSFEQIIEDGKNGFLCENDNSKDLRETIEIVLNLSENEKQQIKKKAKERIDRLKPEIVVNQLIHLYEGIKK